MRLPHPALLTLLLLGCPGGGDTTTGSSSDTSTSSASTGSSSGASTSTTAATASTTDAPTSTGPDPVTTAATTEAITDGTSTTSTSGASTSDASTSGSTSTTDASSSSGSTTGQPGDAQYMAFFIAGGLDRIFVRKADPDLDLCTSITFVWPGPMPMDAIDLPGEWGFQGVEIAQGAADCLNFMGPLPNAVAASVAKGSATWDPNGCPLTLDINVALTFPQVMPWVPAQDLMMAFAVAVQNC